MRVIFPCADSEAYMLLNQDRINRVPFCLKAYSEAFALHICAQRGSGYACVAKQALCWHSGSQRTEFSSRPFAGV